MQSEVLASSAATAQRAENSLMKELASHTCPICYNLMASSQHAPTLLFPCGHSFCEQCITSHCDTHRREHCPVCREPIKSRAVNYALQQIIQAYAVRQGFIDGSSGPAAWSTGSGGADAASCAPPKQSAEAVEAARIRREHATQSMRLKVLQNELADCSLEEEHLEAECTAAQAVLGHLQAHRQQVEAAIARLQAEHVLLQEQAAEQQAKVDDLTARRQAAQQQRCMLSDTVGPLQRELEKLDILVTGLRELETTTPLT